MASSQPMPAMPPPGNQKSNFIDPPYQGTKFLVVNCVFLPLAVIALAVRTWTRVFLVRNFRSDDCMFTCLPFTLPTLSMLYGRVRLTEKDLMIIALILSIVMTAVTLDMLNWGLGRHMWDVPAVPDLSPWFMKVYTHIPSTTAMMIETNKHSLTCWQPFSTAQPPDSPKSRSLSSTSESSPRKASISPSGASCLLPWDTTLPVCSPTSSPAHPSRRAGTC